MSTSSSRSKGQSSIDPKRRSTFGRRSDSISVIKSRQNKEPSLHISGTDRIKFKYNPTRLEEEKEFDKDLVILLTTHTWSVHRMCYYPEIDYRKVKLKNYATRIRTELVNAFMNQDSTTYKVKTSQVAIFKNSAIGGLQIEVYATRNTDNKKLKYKGLIFTLDDQNQNGIDFKIKPLFLSYGTANISSIVVKTVSELFDLIINPLRISEDDLMWLAAMLSESGDKSKVRYSFHCTISKFVNNSIDVEMPAKLVTKLWNKIHNPDDEEITYKEVHSFHHQMQAQLTQNFGINFVKLTLMKVCAQNGEINRNGQIKMNNKVSVFNVLHFVSDIVTILEDSCPTISEHRSFLLS